MSIQYDFFKPRDESFEMSVQLMHVQAELTNTRRGLFARLGDMSKLYLDQQAKIEELENLVVALRAGDPK